MHIFKWMTATASEPQMPISSEALSYAHTDKLNKKKCKVIMVWVEVLKSDWQEWPELCYVLTKLPTRVLTQIWVQKQPDVEN